jgi:methyltransferase (TIGR00027 family)
MDPVATTALLVAAIRAEESQRPDRLFHDPFAAALAGKRGVATLNSYRATGPGVPIIEVRTRFLDDALLRAVGGGIGQVVILAAGMDARAYRLPWPAQLRLFELDQPAVIAHKDAVLAGTQPRCHRVAIGIDLASDWPPALGSRGFDAAARTAWLVEGLTQYLDAAAVRTLFGRIDALSAPGSTLLFDVAGQSLLESPVTAPMLEMMARMGAPWRFGTDEPEALVEPLGWSATVTEPGVVGWQWGRWPFQPPPRSIPGVPRGYIVEALKKR